MSIPLAQRLQPLGGNVFDQMDRAKREARRSGLDVIDLSLGSSDLPPPSDSLAAIQSALSDPSTYGYTLFHDTADFRTACAKWYMGKFGLEIDPETEVLPLIGSQQGTALLPLALLNPGDVALVADPAYPSHAGGIHLAGGIPYYLPLRAENRFLPRWDRIPAAICRQARLLVLNYPHNPTTATVTPEFWQETLQFCQQYDIVLAHDFPYVDWRFDGQVAPSALQADPDKTRTIEFFSLSKSYHMGGFRVAYAIGSRELIRALRWVKSTIDFHQYQGILRGAAAALTVPDSFLQRWRQVYRERRDIAVAALHRIGWPVPLPEATMYLWAPLPEFYRGSSAQFCLDLVRATGVALSPGSGFGPSGEGYVRFALVVEGSRLEEAVGRIEAFLSRCIS
ncbi:LL-diaminopimelate aminotransferase [Synechococcus sp. R55.6]|uniref:LL-diaminopimelate aminotransferase n=1 Tax=unclassified Synechococcus TaxID=2626047 RepID=UPI0039C4D010